MNLIDKDKIVSEIEESIEAHKETLKNCDSDISEIVLKGSMSAYQSLLHFLNTIETKEVDLDESARHYLLHEHISPLNEILHQADLKVEMQYHKDIENAYKAGFELSLKAQKGE